MGFGLTVEAGAGAVGVAILEGPGRVMGQATSKYWGLASRITRDMFRTSLRKGGALMAYGFPQRPPKESLS
jgi:hypothetical protein